MTKLLVPLLAVLVILLGIPGAAAGAQNAPYQAQASSSLAPCNPFLLNGAQAGTNSTGTGSAMVTLNPATRLMKWTITFAALSGSPTAAHFHGPALPGQNAGVLVPINDLTSPMTGTATLTVGQMLQALNGEWYVNIHTALHPAGEIRGQVTLCKDAIGPDLPETFDMDGTEAGTNSPGSGSGIVLIDAIAKRITYNLHYQDLTGDPIAGHFHGPSAPGTNAGIVLPFSDLTSPIEGSARLTRAQMLQVLNEQWYANLHTPNFPAGEIRGQVRPNLTPNSGSCLATPFPINGQQAGTGALGTGTGLVQLNPITGELIWNLAFQGLTSAPIAAHFHGPASPGQNAGIQVPITDLTSPSEGSAKLTATQVQQVKNGLWYVNYHTAANPGGEIRGQVTACLFYTHYLPVIDR